MAKPKSDPNVAREDGFVAVVAPEGITVCSVGGTQYEADEDSLFFVAPAHAAPLRAHLGQE